VDDAGQRRPLVAPALGDERRGQREVDVAERAEQAERGAEHEHEQGGARAGERDEPRQVMQAAAAARRTISHGGAPPGHGHGRASAGRSAMTMDACRPPGGRSLGAPRPFVDVEKTRQTFDLAEVSRDVDRSTASTVRDGTSTSSRARAGPTPGGTTTEVSMRLVIKPRGVELTDELRAFTARRIHFALSRAADVVRRVDVTLADVNGPRGGVDKVCRIRLAGRELPEIIVEERDASLEVAVAVAAGRMSRAVLRALDRSRAPYARAAAGASRYARSEAG
jgi:hypothetical protein